MRGVGPGGACARRGRPEGPPPPIQRRSLVLPPVEAADGGVVDGRFLLGRESTVGWFLSFLFALSLCFLFFVGLLWVAFRFLLRVSFPLSLRCFFFSS